MPPIRMVGAINTPRAREKVLVNRHRLAKSSPAPPSTTRAQSPPSRGTHTRRSTVVAASSYANSLVNLKRFEEAKSVLRKTMPVARRAIGESHELTLKLRRNYALALYEEGSATLDVIREAVTALEDLEQTARRVLGGTHPTTVGTEYELRNARAALAARETPDA